MSQLFCQKIRRKATPDRSLVVGLEPAILCSQSRKLKTKIGLEIEAEPERTGGSNSVSRRNPLQKQIITDSVQIVEPGRDVYILRPFRVPAVDLFFHLCL